jgi:RimJ/RimL family protein N-acetyltransferase
MKRDRYWMKISAKKLNFPLLPGFDFKSIHLTDAESLGRLMDSSYRDTIDHEGESLEQCIQEMKDTIQGKYGPFIHEASFVVIYKNQLASAILMTEWRQQPLVAYTMTDKTFLGKGLAKYLLGRAVSTLESSKWKEIFLVVTEGNIAAEKLYEKVGFTKAGLARPGTPPPVNN